MVLNALQQATLLSITSHYKINEVNNATHGDVAEISGNHQFL